MAYLPGKEYGKFARYDKEGRELVYVGLDGMVMHRDVLDKINAEWDREFGRSDAHDETRTSKT